MREHDDPPVGRDRRDSLNGVVPHGRSSMVRSCLNESTPAIMPRYFTTAALVYIKTRSSR